MYNLLKITDRLLYMRLSRFYYVHDNFLCNTPTRHLHGKINFIVRCGIIYFEVVSEGTKLIDPLKWQARPFEPNKSL